MPTPGASPDNRALVVGAGPAGVSAAQWLRTYDVPFDWYDADGEVGGMLDQISNPLENYPASNFDQGAGLADLLARQVDELDDLAPKTGSVAELERAEGVWRVAFERNGVADRRIGAVVLATGTRYRRLEIPGESEGLGDYVSQSTSRDAARFAGRTVAVVGGGDAGFEGALQLAEAGCDVHMLLRNDDFRARPGFVDDVRDAGAIQIHPIPSVVRRIDPLPPPRGCRLTVDVDGDRRTMEVACLFVRIGYSPVYPELCPRPETDDEDYLVVDRRQSTSAPDLFAAGDVTDTDLPAVAVAVGGGARAALSVAESLGYT